MAIPSAKAARQTCRAATQQQKRLLAEALEQAARVAAEERRRRDDYTMERRCIREALARVTTCVIDAACAGRRHCDFRQLHPSAQERLRQRGFAVSEHVAVLSQQSEKCGPIPVHLIDDYRRVVGNFQELLGDNRLKRHLSEVPSDAALWRTHRQEWSRALDYLDEKWCLPPGLAQCRRSARPPTRERLPEIRVDQLLAAAADVVSALDAIIEDIERAELEQLLLGDDEEHPLNKFPQPVIRVSWDYETAHLSLLPDSEVSVRAITWISSEPGQRWLARLEEAIQHCAARGQKEFSLCTEHHLKLGAFDIRRGLGDSIRVGMRPADFYALLAHWDFSVQEFNSDQVTADVRICW